MSTFPYPSSFNVGQQVNSTQMQSLSDSVTWIYNGRPLVSAYQTTNASLANQTWVTMTMPNVEFDTATGMAFGNGVYDHYTSRVSGWYLVIGNASVGASGSAGRSCAIRLVVNGLTVAGISSAPLDMSNGSKVNIVRMVYLAVGDYLQLQAYQDSGATINTNNGGSRTTRLDAVNMQAVYFGG